jgi:hypothetical protein
MNPKKINQCGHCGGKEGNLIFVSDGKASAVRHFSPYECIEELLKKIRQVDTRTVGLTILGG